MILLGAALADEVVDLNTARVVRAKHHWGDVLAVGRHRLRRRPTLEDQQLSGIVCVLTQDVQNQTLYGADPIASVVDVAKGLGKDSRGTDKVTALNILGVRARFW